MSGMFLLINSRNGTRIPKIFADHLNMLDWHINKSVAEKLSDGDVCSNDYWHTWDYVLSSAYYIDPLNGNKWELWQDGDLWAVCYDLLTEEEKVNFGFDN